MPGVIDIIKTGVWKSTGGCLIRRKQAVPLFMTTERFGVSEIMSAAVFGTARPENKKAAGSGRIFREPVRGFF